MYRSMSTSASRNHLCTQYYIGDHTRSKCFQFFNRQPIQLLNRAHLFRKNNSIAQFTFLPCLRPSSDSRRSILEMDALLRPVSYPSLAAGAECCIITLGEYWKRIVIFGICFADIVPAYWQSQYLGRILRRIMRATAIELMTLEQRGLQYRSSRERSVTMPRKPGKWLDDILTKTSEGGGLLSSLSGSTIVFKSDQIIVTVLNRHPCVQQNLSPVHLIIWNECRPWRW